MLCLVPNTKQRVVITSALSCLPLSEIILCGSLNQQMISSHGNLCTSCVVMLERAHTLIHLVKYFVLSNKKLLFPESPFIANGYGLSIGCRLNVGK